MNSDLHPDVRQPAPQPDPAARTFDAKSFVDALPGRPGVYRMLDAQGTILYVGKARNLKSRVGSYFQAEQCAAQGSGAGGEDGEHGSHDHEFGHRGAAARIQPHQEAPAALQRGAARRQELPLPAPRHGARFSAPQLLSRLAQGARPLLRALPVGGCGAREPAAAAKAVSAAQLRRRLFRQPLPALPAISDPALHGALRRPDHQGALRPRRGRGDQGAGGAQR